MKKLVNLGTPMSEEQLKKIQGGTMSFVPGYIWECTDSLGGPYYVCKPYDWVDEQVEAACGYTECVTYQEVCHTITNCS